MIEPDHVVVESPGLSVELDEILARFGVDAVVRVLRGMAEDGASVSSAHAERGETAGPS